LEKTKAKYARLAADGLQEGIKQGGKKQGTMKNKARNN
jgi:hypothetical protein